METSITTRQKPSKVRLIDANALMKEIAPMDKWCYCGSWKWCMCKERKFCISEVIKKIESAPTVDISELQEKAWKYDELCK